VRTREVREEDVPEEGDAVVPGTHDAPSVGVALPSQSVSSASVPAPVVDARGIGRCDPKGGGWLIRGVSLALYPGERLAVLGPSGAGKTVLLRCLAMLDPLDEGTVRWQGHAVKGETVPTYRCRVIYLHQRPALLDGTVEDNLRLPFTLGSHRGRTFDQGRVVGLLERVGRDAAFLGKPGRDLSGGEGQLVALLRAVQLDPDVLLLDEPTASLDAAAARAVEGLVDQWYADGGGRALVWVSHDRDQARRVTGRALQMRAGRLEPGG
jgi:putative ABC transport system ATP-binding protein